MKVTPPAWAIRTASDHKAIEQGCYWDTTRAKAIVQFAEQFFRSQYIDGKFKLLEWQKRFLQSLVAFRMPDGSRRFKFANLHCSKKNGKTFLVAIVALYELFYSNVPSPFIIVGAASRDNASQVFDEIAYSLEHCPQLESLVAEKKIVISDHKKTIAVTDTNSKLKTIAADGKKQHGPQPHIVILDEAAQVPPTLFKALRHSGISRKGEKLFVCISTAGTDTTHWYYSIYTKSKKIISGEVIDVRYYAEVYECDEGADIEQPEQWYKCCPSLGTSYSEQEFREELEAAKSEGLGSWLNFQNLMLSKWIRADEHAYFEVSNFDKYGKEIDDNDLVKLDCIMGIDLSETTCPTSVSLMWDLQDGTYYIKNKAWVCEEALKYREKTNLAKYESFEELEITAGDMLDIDEVMKYCREAFLKFNIIKVNFDPRAAYILLEKIESEFGVEAERFIANYKNYDRPMSELNRAIKEGRIFHNNSKWLTYCLSNVRIDVNKYGEVAPRQSKSIDHIDAAITALLCYMEFAKGNENIITNPVIWA